MKFGYFANIHDTSRQRDYSEMVAEMREVASFCDDAGFEAFWLPEHHFSVWGREMLGNPLLMAADLAARTKHMRIGLSAAIITFWHPLRLAEDLALLDHLTDGRLEIGVGRGNYGLEAMNLNPDADPNNQAGNLAVFLETLEIIKKAMSQERFSHKGEVLRISRRRTSAPTAPIRSTIRPMSTRRPAISSSCRSFRAPGRSRCPRCGRSFPRRSRRSASPRKTTWA